METQNQPKIEVPSTRVLAKATGIALAVALVLLFTAVLPAEYGFDPLKTGKALAYRILMLPGQQVKALPHDPHLGKLGLHVPAQDLQG